MLNTVDQLLEVSWEASMTGSGRKVAPSDLGNHETHSHQNIRHTVIQPPNCFLGVKPRDVGGHGGL